MRIEPLVPDLPGYRDATLISTGSTSLVFRAVQTRLARTVAIKVLLVDGDAATHAQYQRELETTVLLSSQPHIVGIIDTGTTDAGNPYIVMEYCPGGSYGQILKQRGPLPVDEVIDVGMKIAEALQAAHDVGVLHRDVKPSNILRSAFGPALADFGIARAPHQLAGTTSLDQMTPHHASPEAMRKDNQSPASDLYSLASTLWHLLAGRPPFADPARGPQDLESLRQQVLNEPAPRVPRADVPDWLQRELLRALAKDPRQRHPSAYTFAEVLRYQAYRAMPETAAPGSPAAAPQSPAAPTLPGAPNLPAAPHLPGAPNLPAAPHLPAAQAPVSGPPQPPVIGQPPATAPQSAPPQVSGPPAPSMPPVAGWPSSPATAPREAFRWPSAAPTRRDEPMLEVPVPALDPAAKEVAAASTIIWRDQPADQPAAVQPNQAVQPGQTVQPGQEQLGQEQLGQEQPDQPVSGSEAPVDRSAAGRGETAGPATAPGEPELTGDPAPRESSIGAALMQPTEVRPAVSPVPPPHGGANAVPHQVQPPVSAPPRSSDRPGSGYGTSPYAARSAPPYGSPTRPVSSPPVSGPPRSGPPMSGPPMSGPPMSGPPMSGPPASGPPMSRPPASGPPMSGPPASGPPMSGPPASGPPVAGRPMSGPPMSGPPMSGPPLSYGGPARTSAPPAPAVEWPGEPSPRRRRGPLIAVATGSAVALIAVIGVVAALNGGSSPNPGPPVNPSGTGTLGVTSQGAPTNVKLDDKGSSVTVTWADPTDGTVTFAVLGAPEGNTPHLLTQVQAGTTSYTQDGINSAVDYCYYVAAIYSASSVANSSVVCTHRTG